MSGPSCRDRDDGLDWFSSRPSDEARARNICMQDCPVRRECLHDVMTYYSRDMQPEGVWAGLGRAERKRLRIRWGRNG